MATRLRWEAFSINHIYIYIYIIHTIFNSTCIQIYVFKRYIYIYTMIHTFRTNSVFLWLFKISSEIDLARRKGKDLEAIAVGALKNSIEMES